VIDLVKRSGVHKFAINVESPPPTPLPTPASPPSPTPPPPATPEPARP
jgi:hypothetical protein